MIKVLSSLCLIFYIVFASSFCHLLALNARLKICHRPFSSTDFPIKVSSFNRIKRARSHFESSRVFSSTEAVDNFIDASNSTKTSFTPLTFLSKPIVIKSLASMVGFILGDSLAQLFLSKSAFSASRCGRMALLGLLVYGPMGYIFYSFRIARTREVDKKNEQLMFPVLVPPVVKKIFAEQLIWVPFITIWMFLINGIAMGSIPFVNPLTIFKSGVNIGVVTVAIPATYSQLIFNIKQVVVVNWIVRSVAHTVNFKLLKPGFRLVFFNTVQILLNMYASNLMNVPSLVG
jgi:hypothetical protein